MEGSGQPQRVEAPSKGRESPLLSFMTGFLCLLFALADLFFYLLINLFWQN